MLLFAHTGITLGLGWLAKEQAAGRLSTRYSATALNTTRDVASPVIPEKHHSAILQIAADLDLRVLVIGSMLPDIVDKPLGQFILRQSLSNGRIYCHTLLFLMLLVLAGVFIYRRRQQTGVILLAAGTITHLIMDEMWRTPQTLLWPLLGLDFPREELTISGWLGQMFLELCNIPRVFVPEAIGFVVLVTFISVLLKRHVFATFLRYGLLNN